MKRRLVWLLLGLVGIAGCASVQAPEGGPRDTQPPRLVSVDPPNESLYFKSKRIVFTFDEFLKTTELSSNVFVSPLIEPPIAAYAQNKRVYIRLPERLADSTTYVITLYEGIKDENEGNGLAAPIRYAFSTGDLLDGGRVAGRVVEAWNDKPASGWLVALYDTPPDSGFWQQKPAYATQTDAGGQFELAYLRPGRYRLLAFQDRDRNFRLSQANEALALLPRDEIQVDSSVVGLELRGFRPDDQPPRLKGISRPTPFSLLLEFDEVVEAGAILEYGDKRDTLRQHLNGRPTRLLAAWSDKDPRDSIELRLRAVVDTAGNRRDTTLRLRWPPPLADSSFQLVRLDTVKGVRRRMWMSDAPLDSVQLARSLRLETPDSLPLPFKWQFDPPFRFGIELGPIADTLQTVVLRLDSAFRSRDGLPLRQPFREVWDVKALSRLGSISGRWASDSLVPVVIELYNFNTREVQRTNTPVFRFDDLLPAPYQLRVLLDSDGNGRWTTGRLVPRRLPERWYIFPDLITLRPGWQVENVTITWPPPNSDVNKP